jgi:hypothetical protein
MGVVRVGVDRVREQIKIMDAALARDQEERVIEVR